MYMPLTEHNGLLVVKSYFEKPYIDLNHPVN